VVKLQ